MIPILDNPLLITTVTTTKYVPPSDISLHFWWYPMIVISLFTVLFMGVAFGMSVPQEDLITMSLCGAMVGCLISFAMQILPLPFLLLVTAGWVVYLWFGRS